VTRKKMGTAPTTLDFSEDDADQIHALLKSGKGRPTLAPAPLPDASALARAARKVLDVYDQGIPLYALTLVVSELRAALSTFPRESTVTVVRGKPRP